MSKKQNKNKNKNKQIKALPASPADRYSFMTSLIDSYLESVLNSSLVSKCVVENSLCSYVYTSYASSFYNLLLTAYGLKYYAVRSEDQKKHHRRLSDIAMYNKNLYDFCFDAKYKMDLSKAVNSLHNLLYNCEEYMKAVDSISLSMNKNGNCTTTHKKTGTEQTKAFRPEDDAYKHRFYRNCEKHFRTVMMRSDVHAMLWTGSLNMWRTYAKSTILDGYEDVTEVNPLFESKINESLLAKEQAKSAGLTKEQANLTDNTTDAKNKESMNNICDNLYIQYIQFYHEINRNVYQLFDENNIWFQHTCQYSWFLTELAKTPNLNYKSAEILASQIKNIFNKSNPGAKLKPGEIPTPETLVDIGMTRPLPSNRHFHSVDKLYSLVQVINTVSSSIQEYDPAHICTVCFVQFRYLQKHLFNYNKDICLFVDSDAFFGLITCQSKTPINIRVYPSNRFKQSTANISYNQHVSRLQKIKAFQVDLDKSPLPHTMEDYTTAINILLRDHPGMPQNKTIPTIDSAKSNSSVSDNGTMKEVAVVMDKKTHDSSLIVNKINESMQLLIKTKAILNGSSPDEELPRIQVNKICYHKRNAVMYGSDPSSFYRDCLSLYDCDEYHDNWSISCQCQVYLQRELQSRKT